jgi:hypothetical protein
MTLENTYMNTKKTILTTIVIVAALATVGAAVAQSIVSHQAFADPPAPEKSCKNNGGQDVDDKDTCPGGGNSGQEEICVAKNKGLQKKLC